MNEWKECKLGDVADFKNGKSRPPEIGNGKIPIYGGNGILGYTDKSNFEVESVVVGRVGAYCGSVFYVNYPVWVSDNALNTIPKAGTCARFLYYLLKKMNLNSQAEGSSHPLLTQTLLNSLDILIPVSLPEQQAIAGVLSCLDDKIDLLHQQNKTLEGMAQTLWRKMFVEDAKPDWKPTTIGEVAKFNEKNIDRNFPYSEIEYLDTGSITDGRISQFQHLSLNNAPSRAKRIVQKNDIILSMIRPIRKHYGILKKVNCNTVVSTGFVVITCNKIDPHFIFLHLTQNDMTEYLEIIAEGSTTAYPSLVPSDIEKIVFQMPPTSLIKKFSEYASHAWDKIEGNYLQIRTLTRMRDTLLPKLMSGELKVKL